MSIKAMGVVIMGVKGGWGVVRLVQGGNCAVMDDGVWAHSLTFKKIYVSLQYDHILQLL